MTVTHESTGAAPAAAGRARITRPLARAAVLTNGRLVTLLTARGTGSCMLDGIALTRWAGDPIEDRDGMFVYARDLDTGAAWSLARRPCPGAPEREHTSPGPYLGAWFKAGA